MTQQKIEKITSQITKFLERFEDDTALLQVNICRGGLTGISVVPPAGEIKHFSASVLRNLTTPARDDIVRSID